MLYAKLFRSRWAALIWAAGILWMAVDVAGYAPARKDPTANATAPADTDATGEVVQNSDLEILAGIMNGN
ncbi:MAG: hypothetical protein ABIS51_21185 [Sphingomonas sp.]